MSTISLQEQSIGQVIIDSFPVSLLIDYSMPIAWGISFFAHRLIVRAPEETYKQRAITASIVATVAFVDYQLRDNDHVSTNVVTYGTVVVSYVLPNTQYIARNMLVDEERFLIQPVVNLVAGVIAVGGAVIAGGGTVFVVQYGYVPQAVAPVVTSYASYNIAGPKVAVISGALSILDEVLIYSNITNTHYLSLFVLSQGISGHFLQNQFMSFAFSGLSSAVIAPYEEEILEAFLPINSTKQAYYQLLELSGNDVKSVNRLLETGLVITANIEISHGVLFMQMLQLVNLWFVKFSAVCDDPTKFHEFVKFSKKQMSFEFSRILVHGVPLVPVEDLMLWRTKKYFQAKFLERVVFNSSNFLLISKSGLTTEVYSNDIGSMISNHWKIYQELTKNLPLIIGVTSFGSKAVLIPVIAAVDYLFASGLNIMQEKIKESAELQTKSFATIGVIEKHDLENANVLVHTKAINHANGQWLHMINSTNDVMLRHEITSDLYNSFYQAYWEIAIWGGVPVVVAYLASGGYIASDGMFTGVMTIKSAVETILIKSKKKQQLNEVELAMKRLDDLFMSIAGQVNIFTNITLGYNSKQELVLNNFKYVRGNDQANITVSLPNISFKLGKRYGVTGSNGSGKSSLLILLSLLLNRINDNSFLSVEGEVSESGETLAFVTQKEYCPVHTDLFSWLLYPRNISAFSTEDIVSYQKKVFAHLEELKFTPKNLTAVVEEFRDVKSNWCGELSGGQVKKIQLLQQVFLHDKCPKIVLLDEVMGPLDPESKEIVARKLSEHCKDSLVISVYHYDATTSCILGDGMFDYNVHFENGSAFERPLC
jgi:ABC-type transport system involved in cytochrome bd biosynthesis fused ATPase/permease subunit